MFYVGATDPQVARRSKELRMVWAIDPIDPGFMPRASASAASASAASSA